MTRLTMTLEGAVGLVLYAFEGSKLGDIFVQNAPAGIIGLLATALKRFLQVDNPIQVIGASHGEKQ